MTFTELCQFCLVLIGLADLIVRIIEKKVTAQSFHT